MEESKISPNLPYAFTYILNTIEKDSPECEFLKKEVSKIIEEDKEDIYQVRVVEIHLNPFFEPYVNVLVKVLDSEKWYKGKNRVEKRNIGGFHTFPRFRGEVVQITIDFKEF